MKYNKDERIISINVSIDDPADLEDDELDLDWDEEIFDDMTDLSRIIARDLISLPDEVRRDYYEYFLSELMSRLLEKGIDFWNEEEGDGEM